MHDEPHHRADAVVDELVDDLVHPPDELPGPIERFVHRPWVRAVVAGICLAASLPPWGFWPLAFVGVALLDRLLAGAAWRSRLWRGTLVGWTLFFPTILWISQLTAPGYVIASLFFGFLIGAACLLVPPHAGRGLALIGAWVLVESLRTAWPFGGVPLSLLAVGQVAGVLWPIARVGGVLGIAAATVAVGVAVSAAFDRHHTKAAAFAGFAIMLLGVAAVAPSGEPHRPHGRHRGQGGGRRAAQAIDTDRRKVFERHLDASARVPDGMDMVLWPENVVDTSAGRPGRPGIWSCRPGPSPRRRCRWARWRVDEESFRNSQQVLRGRRVDDRYVKVQRVPFGGGCRSVVDREGGARHARQARRHHLARVRAAHHQRRPGGHGHQLGGVLRPPRPFGRPGRRQLLYNPTNGSTYTGTFVQTQQVASSRLRAIESGRWLVRSRPPASAPT
ncbi:MAG: hypothetical protein R2711_07245 [Acidimicrobiales bacterium]